MARMPRHDPVPPRPEPNSGWVRYRQMMRWMALAALVAVLLSLIWLKSSGTEVTIHMTIATIAGVGLSVLLGTALMGLVFLSNSSGHDEDAAHGGQERD